MIRDIQRVREAADQIVLQGHGLFIGSFRRGSDFLRKVPHRLFKMGRQFEVGIPYGFPVRILKRRAELCQCADSRIVG